MNTYCVYLLVSLLHGHRYVGITTRPKYRLIEHNQGLNKATVPYRPFRMIILRCVSTRKDARRSEKYFKSGYGRKAIDALMASERRLGHHVHDAEKEALLHNPFC